MIRKILSTIFTKGFVALVNLAILLVSSKQLGGDVRGQISLLILNIAIVQAVNEIYTGYALVYFIPTTNLKKIYINGIKWTLLCTALMSSFFFLFDIGLKEQWFNTGLLSLIIILHSFHGVIILSKEKIGIYNFLNFFQPTLLLIILIFLVFVLNERTVLSYVWSLYISFITSLVISSVMVFNVFKYNNADKAQFDFSKIVKNGFYNQLANLSHMLSNRYNFYLLGSTTLVGIYSNSTSLIESVLIISSSVAPIILTYIANKGSDGKNVQVTFLLAKLCFLLSLACVVVLILIPSDFFSFLLGKDFSSTKQVMLSLSPGVLVISFSTIISHYYSALGKQKLIATANFAGLLVTIMSSYFLIHQFGLFGACYATCLSYFVASVILVYNFMMENALSVFTLFKLRENMGILKKL